MCFSTVHLQHHLQKELLSKPIFSLGNGNDVRSTLTGTAHTPRLLADGVCISTLAHENRTIAN
jgi:hypothetical protein